MNYQSHSIPISPPLKRPVEPHSTFIASAWRDINGQNSIRGACTIYTRSGFVFNSVFLHVRENEDGTRLRWVQLPGIKQPDGKFLPIVEFATKESSRSFTIACLNAIDELLRPGGDA